MSMTRTIFLRTNDFFATIDNDSTRIQRESIRSEIISLRNDRSLNDLNLFDRFTRIDTTCFSNLYLSKNR